MSSIEERKAGVPAPLTLKTGAVGRLLRPKSVAIVGFSSREGAAGRNALKILQKDNFPGQIHLVGRAAGEFSGMPILDSIDKLPHGVDLAVLAIPASAVHEAVQACVSQGVGAAVVFASGFAETGADARSVQEQISAVAEQGGLGLVGPNCLGFTNYVDRIEVGFLPSPPCQPLPTEGVKPVAVIAQSGGLMGMLSDALATRRVPIAYRISTGNEAGLGLPDYVAYMANDAHVGTIVVYAEHIRRPQDFLAAVRLARAAGKQVVLMHTGRGSKAQHAAASHTGALAGDYKIMATMTSFAGVIVVETIEELIDCSELAARFPVAPTGGHAVVTTSGAFCAIALDTCDDIGLDLPAYDAQTTQVLRDRLPDFSQVANPLDLGTQPAWEPTLIADAVLTLVKDPAIGSVTIAVPLGQGLWVKPLVDLLPQITKPVQLGLFNDNAPLPPAIQAQIREAGLILSGSPERALRAMARYTQHGRRLQLTYAQAPALTAADFPALKPGVQAEWVGKQVLSMLRVRVPEGALVQGPDEAVAVANRIGYPVVLKVQACELAHKTEIGGVLINLRSDDALRTAFAELDARVRRLRPDVKLDGMLVEKMAGKGLELVAGATRDPQWGPVIMVGMGGIFVEALGDVRLIPAGLDRRSIAIELEKLKLSKLLGEFRGAPAPDVAAAAEVVESLGLLMLQRPEITEVDVNPLVALPAGEGAIALDALIVTAQ